MNKLYTFLILIFTCSSSFAQQYVFDIIASGTGSSVSRQVGRATVTDAVGESIWIRAWGEGNTVIYDGYILGSATSTNNANYSIKRELVFSSKPTRIWITLRRWDRTQTRRTDGSIGISTHSDPSQDFKIEVNSSQIFPFCIWNNFTGYSGSIKAIASPIEKRYPQFTDVYKSHYCEFETISMELPCFLNDYSNIEGVGRVEWYVKEGSSATWNLIPSASGKRSIALGINDLYNPAFSQLGKFGVPRYIKMCFNTGGTCDDFLSSYVSQGITFYRDAPNLFTVNYVAPSCPGGDDGKVIISDLKYPDGSNYTGGELLTYELTRADLLQTINYQSNSTTVEISKNTNSTFSVTSGNWMLRVGNSYCDFERQVSIPSPVPLQLTSASGIIFRNGYHIACEGGTSGTIQVRVSNGLPPYTYELYTGTNLLQSTSRTNTYYSFAGLSAGNYTVKVRDNCYASGLSSILSSGVITLLAPQKLQSSSDKINVACKGGNSGKIDVLAWGGVTPYSYSRNNGSTWQASSIFNSLTVGSYSILVKDANDCIVSESVTISEPSSNVTLETAPVITHPLCKGLTGSIYVNATGGIEFSPSKPYKYYITGRADTIFDAEATFTGVFAGTHQVNVKDGNGCILSRSVSITEPGFITLSPNLTHVICKGQQNGEATFSISGGTPAYQIEWVNNQGSLIKSETINNPYVTKLEDLKAGIYKIRVKDINNCTNGATGWYENTFVIQEPEKLVLSTSVLNNIRCKGESNGSITLAASGGWNQNPYQYSTDNVTYNIANTFSNLTIGNYTYYVKDNKGCVDDTTLTISEPAISFSSFLKSTKMVSCKGGNDATIEINAIGGWIPYFTSVDGGNTWNETTYIEDLTHGNYIVQVKDNGGCIQPMNVAITEPAQVLSIGLVTVNNSSCGESNGSAIVNASGGTSPYTFVWKNSQNVVVAGDSARAVGLLSGTYNSEVIDHNGCSAKFNNINISDIEAPELSIVSIVGVNCPGESTGSATLEIVSGIQPVTIEWPDGQTGLNALNLPGAALDVVVKDGNGCKVFFPVSIPTPDPFHFDIIKQLPNCKGECNGAISVNVSGGTSPYNYSWEGNSINVPSLSDICPAAYKLNILDQRNCNYSEEIELPDQAPLTANLQDTVTLCVGQQIELKAGNPGSTYTWTRNDILISNNNSIIASQAGQYILLLQDVKGCQGRDTMELITSTSFLQADFLMTSKAIVGDTIVLFEISSPAPESIHWTFDANALVYNNAGDIQQVIYSTAGTYPVKLESTLAECYDDVIKYITIYETQDDLDESNPLGFKEASLISFIVYPNPNSGDFQATIELTEEQDVELRMANLITSEVVFERNETGKSKYDIQFNQLNITPGFYVLSLKAGDKYRTLKILVQ